MLLIPQPPQLVPEFEQSDKLLHLLDFLVLAALADLGWPRRGFDSVKYVPLALYGAATELLQHFVPGRSTSGWDLLADLTGIALYALLLMPLLRRWELR
ncbi:MAG: VanZ family protein [Gammaproteobacteria bacterium]|nr:MAG: VanZ family protein [Gammaproteobacteria bacterium]